MSERGRRRAVFGALLIALPLAVMVAAAVGSVALPLRAESRISEIVRRLADSTAAVYVVADVLVFDLVHAQWSNVQNLPVVSVFESPFYGVNGWLKRVEDLVLGSLILMLIAVPMATAAASFCQVARTRNASHSAAVAAATAIATDAATREGR